MLGQATDATGDVWLQIRIPARPNGRTGWVGRTTSDRSRPCTRSSW